jgi:Arc/MetJ-type ribon-helix-helix transcriptional regulator
LTDVMVSIRMPKPMLSELKELAKSQYFLDLSEMVRSLVRSKWVQNTNPELFELKTLSKSIEEELKKKSVEKVREEVNNELEKIKEQLKKEGLFNAK